MTNNMLTKLFNNYDPEFRVWLLNNTGFNLVNFATLLYPAQLGVIDVYLNTKRISISVEHMPIVRYYNYDGTVLSEKKVTVDNKDLYALKKSKALAQVIKDKYLPF